MITIKELFNRENIIIGDVLRSIANSYGFLLDDAPCSDFYKFPKMAEVLKNKLNADKIRSIKTVYSDIVKSKEPELTRFLKDLHPKCWNGFGYVFDGDDELLEHLGQTFKTPEHFWDIMSTRKDFGLEEIGWAVTAQLYQNVLDAKNRKSNDLTLSLEQTRECGKIKALTIVKSLFGKKEYRDEYMRLLDGYKTMKKSVHEEQDKGYLRLMKAILTSEEEMSDDEYEERCDEDEYKSEYELKEDLRALLESVYDEENGGD